MCVIGVGCGWVPLGHMSVQGMHILILFSSTSILLLGHARTHELWSTTKLSARATQSVVTYTTHIYKINNTLQTLLILKQPILFFSKISTDSRMAHQRDRQINISSLAVSQLQETISLHTKALHHGMIAMPTRKSSQEENRPPARSASVSHLTLFMASPSKKNSHTQTWNSYSLSWIYF